MLFLEKAILFTPKQVKKIGEVTSGAKSPSLDKMIGLGYIQENTKQAWIDIRDTKIKAHIISKPFLKK